VAEPIEAKQLKHSIDLIPKNNGNFSTK